ncbi:MAG TPA: hypothetical protein VGL78_10950 [Solirubrobacteraceae bacterium]
MSVIGPTQHHGENPPASAIEYHRFDPAAYCQRFACPRPYKTAEVETPSENVSAPCVAMLRLFSDPAELEEPTGDVCACTTFTAITVPWYGASGNTSLTEPPEMLYG